MRAADLEYVNTVGREDPAPSPPRRAPAHHGVRRPVGDGVAELEAVLVGAAEVDAGPQPRANVRLASDHSAAAGSATVSIFERSSLPEPGRENRSSRGCSLADLPHSAIAYGSEGAGRPRAVKAARGARAGSAGRSALTARGPSRRESCHEQWRGLHWCSPELAPIHRSPRSGRKAPGEPDLCEVYARSASGA